MTDGNTGIQVAPITEDEMSKVHDILTRAVNAIVGMSQLTKDVDDLRNQVAQLTDDSSRLRRTNDALEESLSNSRRTRQEMELKLNDEIAASIAAQAERDRAKNDLEVTKANLDRRTATLESVTKDRDEAQYKLLELQDELSKHKDMLDKVQSLFGSIVPPKAVQAPVPTPEAAPYTPVSAPEPTPTLSSDPEPFHPIVSEPTYTDTSPIPSEPSKQRVYTAHWMPGSLWDNDKSQYYTEV